MKIEEVKKLKLDGSVLGDRKKLWKAEVDMLDYFISVCNKYDVKVYLVFGTMLGAVRHKGFIPWDEDIDVAVTREDFDKICEFGPKEFKEPYFWQTALTDRNYFFRYGRLRRSDMLGVVKRMDKYEYNNGLFIDVFIIDDVPASLSQRKRIWRKSKYYELVLANYYHPYKAHKKVKLVSPIFRFIAKFGSYEKWYNKYLNSILKPAKKKPSGLVTIWFDKTSIVKALPKEDYLPGIEADFEGKKYLIPNNYDKVLSTEYGDYMRLPSEEERLKWHDGICIFSSEVSYKEFKEAYPNGYEEEGE